MKVVNKIFFIIKLIIFVLYLNVSYAVEFRGAAVETYKGSSSKKKINATLEIAKEKASSVKFHKGDITKLPFEDSSIDFVFTHGLMNYLDDDILKKGISEMFRVSKRWIMHCEKYEKTEKQIDENHKFRNMGEKWLDYKIKFVSDVDLHEDYGQDQTRFTLLKKL